MQLLRSHMQLTFFFMHTQQQSQNEGKRYVYFFFTYNGPNNRISQLFNLLAGSQITQIIHFDMTSKLLNLNKQTRKTAVVTNVTFEWLFSLHEQMQHEFSWYSLENSCSNICHI